MYRGFLGVYYTLFFIHIIFKNTQTKKYVQDWDSMYNVKELNVQLTGTEILGAYYFVHLIYWLKNLYSELVGRVQGQG